MSNSSDYWHVQIGSTVNTSEIYIEVTKDGPYILHGQVPFHLQYIIPDRGGVSRSYENGESFKLDPETYLCRCGLSKNKPYCDNSHMQARSSGVDLTDRATLHDSLQTAEIIEGPVFSLSDDEKLCAFARFCDQGRRIWNDINYSDEQSLTGAVNMAHSCPSGRLLVWNQNNTPVEENTGAEIGLIEDVLNQCSGPIALWGGIPVKSSNGKYYEVRNRQTLCRCGQSANKPFCDGTHASMEFQDGLSKYTQK
ncbi:CDGSH iron-sulfur domain-containing protein [Sphingobacterium sp. HMA12]|uniref:CDGSH iron-sulfur domain-containing protein n=1 Tax=Sphingobacterium sp. HMA12 TaxID=2050894 RepID=UPI000CEA4051|nr:CDGSH iron-sulfur domain-containing protein [Sphingobacterium sp. HMA12]